MSVTFAGLRRLDPRSLHDAAADLSKAATKLKREYGQYRRQVLDPLDRKEDWRGGGQPDASMVVTVNGLAIDTMRMRVAAGNVALVALAAGLTAAQQQMAARNRAVEADGYDMDGNGVITNLPGGNPTVSGAGTQVTEIQQHERRRKEILAFATDVDTNCAAALSRSDEAPVSGQYATPGLLARAERDHANAANDLASAVGVLFDVAENAQRLAANANQESVGVTLLEALAGMDQRKRDELCLAIGAVTAGVGIVILGAGLAGGGAGVTAASGGTLAIAGVPVTVIGAGATKLGAGVIVTGTIAGTKTIHDTYSEARRDGGGSRPPTSAEDVETASNRIANGHAYEKHVIRQREFPEVEAPDDLAEVVRRVMTEPEEVRTLKHGRIAYWKDDVVVIHNPRAPDRGTVFRPRDGREFLDELN